MNDDNKSNSPVPLDEARFSRALRIALDQLSHISIDMIDVTARLYGMQTELTRRQSWRSGCVFKLDDSEETD